MKNWTLNWQPSTEIRRIRKLPFRGQVLVALGQSVRPEDPVAEAELPGKIYTLDIARGLGIDPAEVLSCLVRDLGEELAQDDIIAESDGALPRLMRVPLGGKLLACRDGVAMIAAGKEMVSVFAGMIGVISDILPEMGAVITTQGGLLQGIWGNGRVGAGILCMATSTMEEGLPSGDLNHFDEGQVIAAAHFSGGSVVKAIEAKKPAGLILGSMEPEWIGQVLAFPFPVMVLQGFGKLIPNPQAFELLREGTGHEVCLNACGSDQMAGERPEVILPKLSADADDSLPFQAELQIGQRVGVLSGLAESCVATVAQLPDGEVTFESGLTSKAAILHTDEGQSLTVPRSNLIIFAGRDASA
jgi:hypothetical protein